MVLERLEQELAMGEPWLGGIPVWEQWLQTHLLTLKPPSSPRYLSPQHQPQENEG
jgi:hypothetical protein